jgi:hypothetical protein
VSNAPKYISKPLTIGALSAVVFDHDSEVMRRGLLAQGVKALDKKAALFVGATVTPRVDPNRVAIEGLSSIEPRLVSVDRGPTSSGVRIAEVSDSVAHDQVGTDTLIQAALPQRFHPAAIRRLGPVELIDVFDSCDTQFACRPREVQGIEIAIEDRSMEGPLGKSNGRREVTITLTGRPGQVVPGHGIYAFPGCGRLDRGQRSSDRNWREEESAGTAGEEMPARGSLVVGRRSGSVETHGCSRRTFVNRGVDDVACLTESGPSVDPSDSHTATDLGGVSATSYRCDSLAADGGRFPK